MAEALPIAQKLYASDPDMVDPVLAEIAAETVIHFLNSENRIPRSGAELDAWCNSEEEWSAYLAAHPLPTDPASALATEPIPAPPVPESVNPEVSKEEVNKALAKFERTVGLQADMNYQLAEARGRATFGCSSWPRPVLRSGAGRLSNWPRLSSALLTTCSPCRRARGSRSTPTGVGYWLSVNAVRVLIGDGSGKAKGDGTKRQDKARKGKDAKLPWGQDSGVCPSGHAEGG